MIGTYNFKDIVKGTHTNDVNLTFENTSGLIDFSAATMQFRKDYETGKMTKELTIGSGLLNPSTGVLIISSFLVDFEVGLYYYDIILVIDGSKKVYVKGTMKVLQNVTSSVC